jgi:hypothetical protein
MVVIVIEETWLHYFGACIAWECWRHIDVRYVSSSLIEAFFWCCFKQIWVGLSEGRGLEVGFASDRACGTRSCLNGWT